MDWSAVLEEVEGAWRVQVSTGWLATVVIWKCGLIMWEEE
jgi:hypothetical protein